LHWPPRKGFNSRPNKHAEQHSLFTNSCHRRGMNNNANRQTIFFAVKPSA
jgi:hypothetical protein